MVVLMMIYYDTSPLFYPSIHLSYSFIHLYIHPSITFILRLQIDFEARSSPEHKVEKNLLHLLQSQQSQKVVVMDQVHNVMYQEGSQNLKRSRKGVDDVV
jgi:hypothetical protein